MSTLTDKVEPLPGFAIIPQSACYDASKEWESFGGYIHSRDNATAPVSMTPFTLINTLVTKDGYDMLNADAVSKRLITLLEADGSVVESIHWSYRPWGLKKRTELFK